MFTGGAHEQQERSKAWAEGQAPPPSRRIAAIDIFRGLAIFEVVTHHVTGMALRATVPGSDLHLLVGVLNRVLHFAVPGFLFMTAVVLTRAALKRFDVKKYYVGRAKRSLLPYVLWTAIFAVFKVVTGANPPEVLLDWERWQFWLQYGKAYFHLYFLLIALQFYLVLPLLLPLWRRKWPAWAVVLAAAALQVAVLYLNRAYFQFRFPGTMALWYVAPITLGMYFGATYASFEDFWKRNRPYIIAVAVAGGLWYVPQAYGAISGARVNSTSYMLSAWLYTSSMALLLFGIAHSLTRVSQNIQRPIARLGTVSLQIYLLHPALLFFLDRAGFPGNPPLYLLTILGYTLLGLLVPFIVARLLEGTRASLWLFGRCDTRPERLRTNAYGARSRRTYAENSGQFRSGPPGVTGRASRWAPAGRFLLTEENTHAGGWPSPPPEARPVRPRAERHALRALRMATSHPRPGAARTSLPEGKRFMSEIFVVLCVLAGLAVLSWLVSRHVTVLEYEQGVLFMRGRVVRTLLPGRHRLPLFSFVHKLDTRTRFTSVKGQELLTADGVTVRLSVAARWNVHDPVLAITASQDHASALYLALQLALRDEVGTIDTDTLLAERVQMHDRLLVRCSPLAEQLGLRLQAVSLKDLGFSGDLKRAFAQVAQAKREAQASIERARGETATLRSLANAAKLIESNPALLQLRALQTTNGQVSVHLPAPEGRGPS